MTVPSMKQPSAFVPLAMSLVALTMVLVHAAIYGIVREADEGTAAHIFQILMAAQVPIVADQRQSKLPTNDNQNSRCLNKVLPGQVVDFARCLDGNRSTSETTDEADTKGSDTGPCSVESGNG